MVTFWSQLVGFILVLVLAPLVPSDGLTSRALAAGALGGIAGAVGVICLYQALSIGTMSVVSPITAVVAAAVPVVAGLIDGERLGPLAIGGILLGLTAVALVSAQGQRGDVASRAVVLAVTAGVSFGLFYVALARSGDDAGIWPLVAARPASLVLAGALILRSRTPLAITGSNRAVAAGAGVLDMSANALFLLASTRGQLAVVGVIASLYPLSTVALARIIDSERLRPIQWAGLVLAVVALVSFSAG